MRYSLKFSHGFLSSLSYSLNVFRHDGKLQLTTPTSFHLHHTKNLESLPKICSVLRLGSLLENSKVVCSSNGLVCLSYETTIFILNPSTRELTRLPEAPTFQYPGYGYYDTYPLLGLGYSSITQEYKVVRCVYLLNLDRFNIGNPSTSPFAVKEIKVHTVGTDSWRSVTDISDDIQDPGVFLNGALHWLHDFKPEVVISFDVGTEKSVYMHTPLSEGHDNAFLGEFGGLLGVCTRPPRAYSGVEIWVMNHYGVEESWAHQFTIEMDFFTYMRPLRSLETGVLIKIHDGELVIYDPRTESLRDIPNMGGAVAFVESLVPVKLQVGVDN